MKTILICLLITATTYAQSANERFKPAVGLAQNELNNLRNRSRTPAIGMAVMQNGRLLLAYAVGYADLAQRTKATIATRFGIGSITKSLTAVAAVSLEQDSKVDLDIPLETYLPDFHHAGTNMTVYHIITHTSGLDDAFGSQNYWTTQAYTVQQAAQRIQHDNLVFDPGTGFRYATGSYTLAGATLEKATGTPFEKLLQTRVLTPAGMKDTVPNRPGTDIPHLATFYLAPENSDPKPSPPFNPTYKLPGAGYVSTAVDIAAFGDALLREKLLDKKGMERLLTEAVTSPRTGAGAEADTGKASTGTAARPTPTPKPTGYAMGFKIHEDPVHGRIYHLPGGGPGISGWIMLYPKYKMTFAILSNMTGAPVAGSEFGRIQEAFLRTAAR